MSESDTGTINGEQHPELIPDSTAYRLYFIVVSELPNPSPEQRNRQLSHLHKIGLQGTDLATLVNTLGTLLTAVV
jgi:hypothetical protein